MVKNPLSNFRIRIIISGVCLLLIMATSENLCAQHGAGEVGGGVAKKSSNSSTPSTKSTKSIKPARKNIKSVRARNPDLWDFKVSVDRVIRSEGTVREGHSFEWVVRLSQRGEELKGYIVSGRGSQGENVCADATISGSIQDGKVSFVITYLGSCCTQEQMKFTGKLSSDGQMLTGSVEPRDAPRTACYLWYGEIIASKR